MNEELLVMCPYCGETLSVLCEPTSKPVEYVEDCSVCCHPILMRVTYAEEGSSVEARREND